MYPHGEEGGTRVTVALSDKGIGMPAQKLLPPKDELRKMLEAGLTHQQIADKVSEQVGRPISRSSVSVAISREGLSDTKPRYTETVPWRVSVEHQAEYDLWMLRTAARAEREGEESLPADLLRRLVNWKRRLQEADAVVDYSPLLERGFVWVRRRPGVDKGLIREPAKARTRRAKVDA